MAKPKGAPKTGGRKAGTPNKIPREIKELAQVYTADGIEQLAIMAGLVEGKSPSENDTARISAIKELLDRGHGRPPQAITPPEGQDAHQHVINIMTGVPRPNAQ